MAYLFPQSFPLLKIGSIEAWKRNLPPPFYEILIDRPRDRGAQRELRFLQSVQNNILPFRREGNKPSPPLTKQSLASAAPPDLVPQLPRPVGPVDAKHMDQIFGS